MLEQFVKFKLVAVVLKFSDVLNTIDENSRVKGEILGQVEEENLI